jgi:hypothetical protein
MIQNIAVLTGDFIDSRQADQQLEHTVQHLRDRLTRYELAYDLDLRFTRFRGDGWQIFLSDQRMALHATLYILATLAEQKSTLRTRIGIGLGTATDTGGPDLSAAKGSGFIASGSMLDALSPKRNIGIDGDGVTNWHIAVFALCEQIAAGWTTTQAQAIAESLLAPDRPHKDIAKTLGITRQAAQSRLAGAGQNALNHALYAFGTRD